MNINKKDVTLWINVAAFVLSLIATIVLTVANYTRGFSLVGGATVTVYAVVALLLVAACLVLSVRFGSQSLLAAASGIAAVVLMTFAFGTVILERIDLFGGLFSWDNLNTAGWGVFYLTAAATVLFLLAIVLLIVNAFRDNRKEVK